MHTSRPGSRKLADVGRSACLQVLLQLCRIVSRSTLLLHVLPALVVVIVVQSCHVLLASCTCAAFLILSRSTSLSRLQTRPHQADLLPLPPPAPQTAATAAVPTRPPITKRENCDVTGPFDQGWLPSALRALSSGSPAHHQVPWLKARAQQPPALPCLQSASATAHLCQPFPLSHNAAARSPRSPPPGAGTPLAHVPRLRCSPLRSAELRMLRQSGAPGGDKVALLVAGSCFAMWGLSNLGVSLLGDDLQQGADSIKAAAARGPCRPGGRCSGGLPLVGLPPQPGAGAQLLASPCADGALTRQCPLKVALHACSERPSKSALLAASCAASPLMTTGAARLLSAARAHNDVNCCMWPLHPCSGAPPVRHRAVAAAAAAAAAAAVPQPTRSGAATTSRHPDTVMVDGLGCRPLGSCERRKVWIREEVVCLPVVKDLISAWEAAARARSLRRIAPVWTCRS
jgi:hypothetical protein